MNVVYAGIWEGGGLAYLGTLSKFYFTNGAIYILDGKLRLNFDLLLNLVAYTFLRAYRQASILCIVIFLFFRFLFSSSGSYAEYFLTVLSLSRLPFYLLFDIHSLPK